ncbi:hypothetical protein [Achromobacter ruhlandii]|uniref:hypothetical protein n=1 Tax=Achromobacter ruhlandii TaxID=72557 RepID=UPI001B8AE0DA|nr:hypothetical protein [Achromobacter ruhlandii]
MTTKHTPGPWSLETVRTSSGVCHKVGPFPGRREDHPPRHACLYADYPSDSNPADQELLANARLIAAAPELLDALEDLKSELVLSDVDQDYIESHFRRCLNKAAAAIAKATGDRLGQLAAEAAIAKAKGEQQ